MIYLQVDKLAFPMDFAYNRFHIIIEVKRQSEKTLSFIQLNGG